MGNSGDDEIVCLGEKPSGASSSSSGKRRRSSNSDRHAGEVGNVVSRLSRISVSREAGPSRRANTSRLPSNSTGRLMDDRAAFIDLHHRCTFSPPSDTPSESATYPATSPGEACQLEDFVVFAETTEGPGRLCDLSVLDFGEGDRGGSASLGRTRANLADGLRIYGRWCGSTGAPRASGSRGEAVLLPFISHYSIRVIGPSNTEIYVYTPLRPYRLGRAHHLYEDSCRSFRTVWQITAGLVQSFIASSSMTLRQAVRRIAQDTGMPETEVGQVASPPRASRAILIMQLDVVYRHFGAYSRDVLSSMFDMQESDEAADDAPDALIKAARARLKESSMYQELRQVAKLSTTDRLGYLGIKTAFIVEDSPEMTSAVEDLMVQTMRHKRLRLSPKADKVAAKEDTPSANDGRVKFMSSGSKPTWKEVNGGMAREWGKVRLDGIVYSIGDGVLIGTKRGQRKAHIQRIVEQKQVGASPSQGSLHVQWLKELAIGDKDELFLADRWCDDISFHHVIGPVSILFGSNEPNASNGHFCRFTAQSDHRVRDTLRNGCDSCLRKQATTLDAHIRFARDDNGGAVAVGDARYHRYDFVLVDSCESGKPYDIGQILHIDSRGSRTQIRSFRRFASLQLPGFKDERRICATDSVPMVDPARFRGKAFVCTSAEIVDRSSSNAFFCSEKLVQTAGGLRLVPLPNPLRTCVRCCAESKARVDDNATFTSAGRLPFADYYSGAGGGLLAAKPFFDVVTAVEMSETACDSLENNHPDTRVCCSRLDVLHSRALQSGETGGLEPLFDARDAEQPLRKRKRVPALPETGSIVGVMAGIPCQGHSRVNRFQAADDCRNEELFTFMSEVDRLKPAYVVLENVPGFKDERTDGAFVETSSTTSFAHVAMRLLVAQNYQCQLAILDSRAYGSPQNRVRLWIIAARTGLRLPRFPLPTHANPLVKATVFTLEQNGENLTSGYLEPGTPGTGVHPAVTVQEAISDLPGFHFAGQTRLNSPLPSFPAERSPAGHDTRVGFPRPVPYRTSPSNSYQRDMRDGQKVVKDHYTPYRSAAEVQLCHDAFIDPDPPGNARCLRSNGGFRTLMTSNAPGRRATDPVHYEQRRSKTIAEDKRAMGMPDSYELCGNPAEQIHQLGNAWDVHMGQSIVKCIHDAIREEWIEAGRPADLKSWWFHAHPTPLPQK